MAASEFSIVFLLMGLFLILIKSVHVLFKKLDLPDVLGEVTLGFILGPTVIGLYWLKDHPESLLTKITTLEIDQTLLDESGIILSFIAQFAVLLLLFEVGTEIDFDVLKKVRRPAFLSAIGGIILPIITGLLFLWFVFLIRPSLVEVTDGSFLDIGLFLAVALTATSIGISTRIFLDMNKIKTRVAQTVVGAAIFDDIISVTALGFVVTYVSGSLDLNFTNIGTIFIEISSFFIISWLLFKYIIPWIVDKTRGDIQDRSFVVFFSISFMLLMAVLAQSLELAPIIGAFVAGVIIGNEEDFLHIHRDIKPISDWIVPFFFFSIGLQVNLRPIISLPVFIMAVTLTIVALLAKFFGGIAGALLSDHDLDSSKAIGLSMAARGEVTLIFAFTAFEMGYFTLSLYASVISVVMLSSLIVPFLLKITLPRWIDDDRLNDFQTKKQDQRKAKKATSQTTKQKAVKSD